MQPPRPQHLELPQYSFATGINFGPGTGLTALIGILFLFTTAPTGAHLLSRAAHTMGVEFAGNAKWPGKYHHPGESFRRKKKSKRNVKCIKIGLLID